MLTLLSLLAVAVLLVGHELVLARTAQARRSSAARRLILLALLACAVVFGARAQLQERAEAALETWTAATPPFRASGDPFLRASLAAQQPESPFPVAGTPDDIRAWQSRVRDALQARAGIPEALISSVPFQVLEVEEVEGVRRTLMEFTSWDGTRIPAYVHAPAGKTNVPGVLVIPGHGDGIRATAGIAPDYQQSAALELARRGYVTLSPELRGFGLLGSNGMPAHGVVAHAALDAGSFYKAIVARDLQYSLSVLQAWEGVDAGRLAVVGTSLGGELAVFLGAVDDRLDVIVSHSYGGAIGPVSVSESAGDETRQPPHGCHTMPGVNRLLHQEDWFRLLAPRAVQVVRGSQNHGRAVAKFEAAASGTFARFGAAERFEFGLEPGGHEFFLEPAARFLSRWL